MNMRKSVIEVVSSNFENRNGVIYKIGNMKMLICGVFNSKAIGFWFSILSIIVFAMLNHICINEFIPLRKIELQSISLTLIIVLFFLVFYVSFSDPGIIMPSNIPEEEYEKHVPIAVSKGKNFILKHCLTCNIVRDLRVFHCSNCNVCISRHGIFLTKIIIVHGYLIVLDYLITKSSFF